MPAMRRRKVWFRLNQQRRNKPGRRRRPGASTGRLLAGGRLPGLLRGVDSGGIILYYV
jgi:hypothetical protein